MLSRGNTPQLRTRNKASTATDCIQSLVKNEDGFPEVINAHPFGRELCEFANHNIDVFPQHGFMDGGCLAFALAIQKWMYPTETKLVFCGRRGIGDHVAVEVLINDIPLYIDGDGIASGAEIIQKMKVIEFSHMPQIVLDEIGIFAWFPVEEILDYDETGVPDELERRLRDQMGTFQNERISLDFIR